MNRTSSPPAPRTPTLTDGLIVASLDGSSRFEVEADNGCFEVRAERRIDGVPVQVATALTDSQYSSLMGFSSEVLESDPTLEIERKWRPANPRSLDALQDFVGKPISSHVIQQGYLVIDTTEVRLRRQGEAAFLTLKSGGGLIRKEIEIELSAQQCEDLWPATERQRLEKVRSKHSIAQLHGDSIVVEVDCFCGSHAPLVIVECEFRSAEAAEQFAAPDCFGAEVTESKEYKNKALVMHGVPLAPLSGLSLPRNFK